MSYGTASHYIVRSRSVTVWKSVSASCDSLNFDFWNMKETRYFKIARACPESQDADCARHIEIAFMNP